MSDRQCPSFAKIQSTVVEEQVKYTTQMLKAHMQGKHQVPQVKCSKASLLRSCSFIPLSNFEPLTF